MENRDAGERAKTGRNQRLNRELRRIHYRGNPASGPVPVEEVERRALTPFPTPLPPLSQQEAENDDTHQLPEFDQDNIKAYYENSLSQKSERKSEEHSGLCFDESLSSSEDGEMYVTAVSSRTTSADGTHGQDRSASDLGSSDSSDRKTLLTVTAVSITEASSSGTASASATDDRSGLASTSTTEDTSYATAVTSANEDTSFGTTATSATEATFATAATSVAEETATAPPESSAVHRLPLRKRIRRFFRRLARPFIACFRVRTQE